MLRTALLLGIYSYAILILGLAGALNAHHIFLVTIVFVAIFISGLRLSSFSLVALKRYQRKDFLLIAYIVLLAFVNLIGTLGPELGFDALWYHLTIPKIFLANQKIFFIQGGLYYYSVLPKLVEMLYVVSLALGNEIVAKLIHFFFGIFTCVVTYKLARLYVPKRWALLTVALFYSNLVVAWLSITAYVDLARAFYETYAVYFFFLFLRKNSIRYLILSSILLGFAISVKIIAFGSIPIIALLILCFSKGRALKRIALMLIYVVIPILVVLPWLLISLYFTRNPLYPFFSNFAPHHLLLSNLYPLTIVKNLTNVFLLASDPIQPIYLIILPLFFVVWTKVKNKLLPMIAFILLSIGYWYVITFLGIWHGTDQAGSARFITAYLPECSIVSVVAIYKLKRGLLKKLVSAFVTILIIVSFIYRLAANYRYIPVLLGLESKQHFLMGNLNFLYGDFFDENGEIKRIVGNNTVELVNMHNLYYVDFPFTLSEFQEGKKPAYILLQNLKPNIVTRYTQSVYKNNKTHVTLYKL